MEGYQESTLDRLRTSSEQANDLHETIANEEQPPSEEVPNVKDLTIKDDQPEEPTPVDPAETEAAKQLWEKLQTAQATLKALSENDPQRPEKLLAVSSTMGDYHSQAEIKGEGQLVYALELAAEAEGLAPRDDFWRGSSLFTSMALCLTLYGSTKVVDWLRKAIDFGKEALKFLEEHENTMSPVLYRIIYAGRAEKLSRVYQTLYEEQEGSIDKNNLQAAANWQARAVDYTIPEDFIKDGENKRWDRFRDFCHLQIRWFGEMKAGDWDMKEGSWDRLVDFALAQPCDITDSEHPTAQYNWWNVFSLMARRWYRSRDEDHLQAMLSHFKEFFHLGLELNEQWASDGDNPRHVLRLAAIEFDKLTDRGTKWEDHLDSVQTAIALWEQVRSHISRETIDDVSEDMSPVVWLTDLYARRYYITMKPVDGWAYDDLNLENCRMSVTLSSFRHVQDDPQQSRRLSILNKNVHACTVGSSIVTKQHFSISHKSADFADRRLMFLTGENRDLKPSIDLWVRDRTDEGMYLLGGAIRGRDDDVFEFLENYDKPYSVPKENSKFSEEKEQIEAVDES